MKKKTACAGKTGRRKILQSAQVLADWWTRPDAARIDLWVCPGYQKQVTFLWRETFGSSGKSVERLFSALSHEKKCLTAEYERLFVGPAAIPCPPYEAVWRMDRPKHEQGTVLGKSTVRVKQLYAELGLRLRPDQVELADHIAIELEALAYALSIGDPQPADCLIGQLQGWLPPFCGAVVANSQLEFYKDLAEVTWDSLSPSGMGALGKIPNEVLNRSVC